MKKLLKIEIFNFSYFSEIFLSYTYSKLFFCHLTSKATYFEQNESYFAWFETFLDKNLMGHKTE